MKSYTTKAVMNEGEQGTPGPRIANSTSSYPSHKNWAAIADRGTKISAQRFRFLHHPSRPFLAEQIVSGWVCFVSPSETRGFSPRTEECGLDVADSAISRFAALSAWRNRFRP
jgi:hypothetical protein